MARVQSALPVDDGSLSDLNPTQRLERQTAGIIAHRPEIAEALVALASTFQGQAGTLPVRLTELLRLRIAYWNQCRSCMSVRYDPDSVSQDLVCSLERPEQAEDLSDAEKAALRFADLMATDHLAIDDAVYDDLRRYFTEGELVELGLNCAQYVGYGRLSATWAMHEHLGESYLRGPETTYTPWADGALA
jgi:alkylhydroperoxidase family enzyme